jgi:hypothetical protein
MKSPLGVTYNVPEGQEATGVYNDPEGLAAFVSNEPYLSGGVLLSPLPVFDAGGTTFVDSMGNVQSSIPMNLSGIPPVIVNGVVHNGIYVTHNGVNVVHNGV